VIPRALRQIYSSPIDGNVEVSFFEIYNERIYDLLSATKPATKRSLSRGDSSSSYDASNYSSRRSLDLREDKSGRFAVKDLRQIRVNGYEEAMYQLKQGLKSRATAITQSNNQSSRSHSIFQIVLERRGVISKLRIVDLAGSEKYSFRQDLPAAEKAVKAKEVAFINSSLSTLGLCISALADTTRRPPHVPYRNSKLTRVLRDSLDESSNVSMIICVSASRSHVSETLSTLQFANRAKRAVLPQNPSSYDSPRIMPN